MNSPASQIAILAPLSGVLVPLEQVPDPVFAQKMVGDGVSLDPTSGELLAPVSGHVSQLHEAHHAVTITTAEGIEVLVHIGVDTVMLKGAGFTPLVKTGDKVLQGQTLIKFDLDHVACSARSLLTQIIIANGEKVAALQSGCGSVDGGKDIVLTLLLANVAGNAATPTDTGLSVLSDVVVLPNPAGLHARPAAVLAAESKKFVSDIRLVKGDNEANVKSLVAIMALSTKHGDAVRLKATGSDAQLAVQTLEKLLIEGCGEKPGDAPTQIPAAVMPSPAQPSARALVGENQLSGVSASPGLAVGTVVHFRRSVIEVSETGGTPQQERANFEVALGEARLQILSLKADLKNLSRTEILDAHHELLEDPEILDAAIEGIAAGKSAAYAWRTAFSRHAEKLERLDNTFLRERAHDIRDVGNRVLALLAGIKQTQVSVPDNSILIAEELSPSDTASLDPDKVMGFCTTTGGATSHVAILARSIGIPAICGIAPEALALPEGATVVLDGTRGILHTQPSDTEVTAAHVRIRELTARRVREIEESGALAVTVDGHRVEVVANVRNAKETSEGVKNGGEGVGLLRSEFLFDERETAPSEEEQAAEYTAVAKALGPDRTLVIRTLDVGGDKPLPYLPLPKEENPFLGLRGVRVSLEQPEFFRTQLRAILRAAPHCNLHIMFPMIAGIDEFRTAKAILADEMQATGQTAKIGVMIEVPSAAAMADVLAQEADFFSIGTNDLTQYTLAMDRGHPKLAAQADALHPAVLKMIAMTVEGAHKHGKWVGVCGGMASDAIAVPVLLGLGVDELSVSVPAIPSIKAQVKRLNYAECKILAAEVLRMGTAAEVRARLAGFAD